MSSHKSKVRRGSALPNLFVNDRSGNSETAAFHNASRPNFAIEIGASQGIAPTISSALSFRQSLNSSTESAILAGENTTNKSEHRLLQSETIRNLENARFPMVLSRAGMRCTHCSNNWMASNAPHAGAAFHLDYSLYRRIPRTAPSSNNRP